MPTGLLTISQYTTNPPAQIDSGSEIEVRGWYSRNFIAGDGVTPVQGNSTNGEEGPYYSIDATLNGDGDLVVAAHEVQATTLSNPTANYFEGLWVDGAFVCLLMPNTQGATGWQIPTVYGDPIAFDEIATYNRARRLLYPPDTYFTADQTIQEIERLAGDFDYMAVGVNGIGQASYPPVVASAPIVLMENDPRVGSWFNVVAYGGVGNGTTDDTLAFNLANAAALAAGGGVYVPIGTFTANNVTFTVPVTCAPGGKIKPTGGAVTIGKAFNADTSQHFVTGAGGVISFSGNISLAEVWPLWWGGAGDATIAGVGTDNYAAWLACMTAVETMDTDYRGLTIRYPYGRFFFSGPLVPTRQVDIVGVNTMNDMGSALSSIAGGGTVFYFTDGVNGVNLTNPGSGTNAGLTEIRNFSVVSKGKAGATAHGIFASTPFKAIGIMVQGFKGNGFYVSANAISVPSTNANQWYMAKCRSIYNTGNGLLVDNAGAVGDNGSTNAGEAEFCDFSFNGGAGIYDASYLGNSYFGCHAQQNTGPGFKQSVARTINKSTISGFYEEANAANEVYAPTVIIGGTWSSGFTTGSTAGFLGEDPTTPRFLKLMIGTLANAFQNIGATIKQAADQLEILAFKRENVAHGMTSLADTDTYGAFSNNNGENGGLWIQSFTTTNRGVLVNSYVTTEDTTQTGSSVGPYVWDVGKKSGTSAGAMGATSNHSLWGNNGSFFAWLTNNGVFKTNTFSATGTMMVANSGKLNVAPKTNDSWAATIAIDVAISNHVISAVSGTSATSTFNASSGGSAGDWLFLTTEADASGTVTVTFGTNLKSSGTQVTTASHFSTIAFQSDGTRFIEMFRTTNLA